MTVAVSSYDRRDGGIYGFVNESRREWPAVEREMLVGMKSSRSADKAPREGGTLNKQGSR